MQVVQTDIVRGDTTDGRRTRPKWKARIGEEADSGSSDSTLDSLTAFFAQFLDNQDGRFKIGGEVFVEMVSKAKPNNLPAALISTETAFCFQKLADGGMLLRELDEKGNLKADNSNNRLWKTTIIAKKPTKKLLQ